MFYISPTDWKKLFQYAYSAYNQLKSEISGYMIMKKDSKDNYILSNPVILKQEVTSGSCEIEPEVSAKYFAEAFQEYGKDIMFVWWHSHHTMGAFWSGTDTANMENVTEGWSASLVISFDNDYKFRVCVNEPIHMFVDTELHIIGQNNNPTKSINEEVKKLCDNPVHLQRKLFKSSSNRLTYSWMEINEYLEEINNDYIEESITFTQWKKLITKYNKKLREVKSIYKIKPDLRKTDLDFILFNDDQFFHYELIQSS